MLKLSSFVAAITVAATILCAHYIYKVPDLPNFDVDKWWGSGQRPKKEDKSIRPFRVQFDPSIVKDLKQRIINRRPLTKPLEGIQSQYGINTNFLEEKLQYWVDTYDFEQRAKMLNRFPHFKTKIQGLDIHFIRATPNVEKNVTVLPLLMLHGWPSSSKEFNKVIPHLSTQREGYDFVFEVIAPDLPGFGFSEGTNKPGLTTVQIGIIMRNLMQRLGFKKYVIQAGDWGSQCASHLSTMFPNEVIGFHNNMPLSSRTVTQVKILLGALAPSLTVDSRYVNRLYPLSDLLQYMWRESGYFHLQATKPDTIGVALTDSPSGLAAYMMEKIAICCDHTQTHTYHGGLDNLDIDDVLDMITINWVNNNIVTSSRIYAEGVPRRNQEVMILHEIPTQVPTAVIKFLNEVLYQSDWMLRDKYPNLIRSTTLDYGGHFPALQTPDALIEDVFGATAQFLEYHGKVKESA